MQVFTDSSPLLADGPALAARMRRDGYLFLPGLLARTVIDAVQRQVGALAHQAGWLRADRPVEQAIANPAGFCVDPDPVYLATLRRINRLEDYHALKHHPALIGLFQRMLGGPVFPHPRVLMRNIFPAREEFTTKAHQDFPNVQGTSEVYTAWMPLIDCPMDVGPLQVAAGSHGGEVYDFHIGAGAGGIEITDPMRGRWVSGPFAAGDVLIFHSMTVHKGVPNRSDRLRMSMDVRYQLVSEPFNPDNANADGQPLSWEDIYAGWRSDDLKYYWKRLPLTLREFDRRWFDKRDTLAFELAEAGDPRARSVLQRIVARDADAAKRARAQSLLDTLPGMTATGPLRGLRVVEFAGIGPAPFACMLLADMGADVARIDRPGAEPRPHDISLRGRRLVTLDLKRQAGMALALLDRAEVLIEGFRPGVMERLGLGPDPVLLRNPALVYGRMTGWGQTGPLARVAGHDITYIAVTGALGAIGPAAAPVPPLNLLGDFGGGSLYLITGILAALLESRRTGQGQVIDCAIVDGVASMLAMAHSMLAAGNWADARASNLLDGGAPFYTTYECADGRHIAVGALEPQFYAELRRLTGLGPREPQDWAGLRREAETIFRRRTRDEWCALLEHTDACVAPVLSLAEAPSHPHMAARGTFQAGQPAPAPRFSATPSAAGAGPVAVAIDQAISSWG